MPQKWIAALTARVASCMGTAEPLTARLAQMRAVQAVTVEITRELDLTTLLELIVRHAVELTGIVLAVFTSGMKQSSYSSPAHPIA